MKMHKKHVNMFDVRKRTGWEDNQMENGKERF